MAKKASAKATTETEKTPSASAKATKKSAKKSAKKAAAKKAAPKAAKKATVKKAAKKAAAKKAVKKQAAKKATAKKVTRKSATRKAAKKATVRATTGTALAARETAAAEARGEIPPQAANGHAGRQDGSVRGSIAPSTRRTRTPAAPAPPSPTAHVETVNHQVLLEQVAARELPREYGETRVSTLIRDPDWLFVYWELSAADRERAGLGTRGAHSSLLLRLFDATGIDFDGTNAHSHTDIPVNDYTSSWYVRVPQGGRRYVVGLGVRVGNRVELLATSNPIDLPQPRLAPGAEAPWQEADEDVYAQVLQLSGGVVLGTHLSSGEFSLQLQNRLLDTLSSFSGLLSSPGGFMSEEFIHSPGAAQRDGVEGGRDFWLRVGMDVIIYGATEPDAQVTLMGKRIALSPDGGFRLRMALPDGRIEFPVEATSADGEETRSVCPVVERETH